MDNTIMETAITKMIKEIEAKKLTIINISLKRKGITDKLEDNLKLKFSKFVIVHQNNEQTLWYNDGSDEGLRIVTFVTNEDMNSLASNKNFSLTHEISYY